MAFTKVSAAGIETSSNITVNNINTAGIVTANSISAVNGTFSGNVSIAGTITYEDVTNVDSIGVVTARSGVRVGTSASTGTANQTLQVTGGAYVSGSLGIGTTNPQYQLDAIGGNGVRIGLANTNVIIAGDSGRNIEVGAGTSTLDCYIDLHGADGVYGDFAARLIRTTGANSYFQIANRGTGPIQINALDAGNIQFLTNSVEAARITASGSVGIGTAVPVSKLHVQDGYIKLEQNINGENTLFLRNTNTAGNGAYSVIRFSESNDVGNSGNAYIHYFNTGYTSNGFWDARSLAAGTANGNINFNVGGANEFKVWTNNSQKFVINSSGNVGIGSTIPANKLTVNGIIESLSDGFGEGGQIILRATPGRAGAATQYRWNIDNYDNSVKGNDRLRFVRENDGDASSGVEYMSINTDGNLQFRSAAPKILNTSGNVILGQAGSIIQTVTATQTSGVAITASTETIIYNPLISITPRNSNSLIFFDIQFFGYHNSANDFYTSLYVRRNSLGTAISSNQGGQWGDWTRNFGSMVAAAAHADYHFTCWDYPGTTSAVTYLLTGKNHQASRNFQIWAGDGNTAKQMLIVAFEVAI